MKSMDDSPMETGQICNRNIDYEADCLDEDEFDDIDSCHSGFESRENIPIKEDLELYIDQFSFDNKDFNHLVEKWKFSEGTIITPKGSIKINKTISQTYSDNNQPISIHFSANGSSFDISAYFSTIGCAYEVSSLSNYYNHKYNVTEIESVLFTAYLDDEIITIVFFDQDEKYIATFIAFEDTGSLSIFFRNMIETIQGNMGKV